MTPARACASTHFVALYGLTGGIASGKSTAARLFRARGIPVIDADQLAREVVEPGRPALSEIAARWPTVIGADGRLDRAALAAVVFARPAERKALEAILHPRIRAEAAREALEHLAAGAPYVLYEAALLFEIDGDRELPGVILVSASPAVQRARLAARDALSAADIDQRLAAQLPLAQKRARARWILENDGDEAALAAQVTALDATLRQLARKARPEAT